MVSAPGAAQVAFGGRALGVGGWRGLALALGLSGALAALALLLMVAVILLAVGVRPALPGFGGVSAQAQADIPAAYLNRYLAAARRYGLDWAVLAGVGKVECDHGRAPDPSCLRHGAVNEAGAGGPAQFVAATWKRYGVDANADGVADRWDPDDAIFALANYLRVSGAPSDYRRALYAYNHAGWYVDEVLAWAARYRAAPDWTATGAFREPLSGPWLARLPGTDLRCDARIIPDVQWLTQRFGLTVTACYAAHGHASHGEHPLGLAIDAVPADGDWSRTLALAQAFGWDPDCATSGCAGRLRGPFRFIGYNGYPGHGDPAHCACGHGAHLHLSWTHTPAAPGGPAAWVDVLIAAGPHP